MRRRRRPASARARVAALGAAVAICLAGVPGIAAAEPPNPTDDEIGAAQQVTEAAVAELTDLATRLAQAQAQVEAAHAASAIALDTYQAKQGEYDTAQVSAGSAAAAARKAAADLARSKAEVVAFARASYISGTTAPEVQAMLGSADPVELLERATLLDAAGGHKADVLLEFARAQRRATATDAAAQDALGRAAGLKQQAADALAAAEEVEADARRQQAGSEAQQAALVEQLQQAQQTLIELEGARAAAVEYERQQAAAQAAVAREQATAAASTSSSPWMPSGPAAGPGSSSAADTAIDAALAMVGTQYAWGGGSLLGPSVGFGIDGGVVGFDCSGLTRYAYAQAGIGITRNSRAQFAAMPPVSRAGLQPGDLVFWAVDVGNPATIHHVALYLGSGRIVEAPYSGTTVRVRAMYWSGYIGAVRPSA